MTHLAIEPITSSLGVRILVSADHLLDEGVPEKCLTLLNEYGVIVFPQICASDEVQIAFSNRLGKMKSSLVSAGSDNKSDQMGIYPVTLDKSRVRNLDYIYSNEHWHIDGTKYAIPPKATNLKCEIPASSGGDTGFANLFAAYRDLPDSKKLPLENLRVVHSAAAAVSKYYPSPTEEDFQRWQKDGPPTEQPLVWKQSDGRRSLVIGSTADYIVGMEPEKSRALLDELLAWCTQDKYCYRHQWKKGDMVIWNNCGLLHKAYPYAEDSGRLMHRTTIMGSEAFA